MCISLFCLFSRQYIVTKLGILQISVYIANMFKCNYILACVKQSKGQYTAFGYMISYATLW